jgi:hypothetical protein
MVPALVVKETATEAWEAIKTLRVGDERRCVVSAQTFRTEYGNIKLRDGEAIEDFALRFAGVIQRLGDLGDPEPEEKAVKKYLRVVRPRYKHLVVSMEVFVDFSKLTIEGITGMLKSSDDADEELQPSSKQAAEKSEKLLLTHEEWLEKYKPHSQEGGRGGSNSAAVASRVAGEASRAAAVDTRALAGRLAPAGLAQVIHASVVAKRAIGPMSAEASSRRRNRTTWPRRRSRRCSYLSTLTQLRRSIPKSIRRWSSSRRLLRRFPPTAPSTSSRTRSSLPSTTPATGIQSEYWTPRPPTI